ncbi:hypothetical protein QE152_g39316 [Popillia japonica]|uniref:Uncharacterized protein n=1 Tax=Popillia japonica TaxID=7064 RepID=A0AAW1HU89_POPJA
MGYDDTEASPKKLIGNTENKNMLTTRRRNKDNDNDKYTRRRNKDNDNDKCNEPKQKIRAGTWNIQTLNGKEVEVIDEMKMRGIRILGISESKNGKEVEVIDEMKMRGIRILGISESNKKGKKERE